jgi:phosphate transport system permease protein
MSVVVPVAFTGRSSRGDLDRVECVDMAVLSVDDIAAEEERVRPRHARSGPDKVYRGFAFASGGLTLSVMGLIGLFLIIRAWPALHEAGFSFFTNSAWEPSLGKFGVWAALLGTFLIAIIALVIAVPVATCSALFVTEYAPARLRRPLTSFIDVLAAIPSLIYGLWGRAFLQPRAIYLSRWLGTHFGFIPFFKTQSAGNVASYPASTFIAGIVVALMIVPICTAVMREVFSQAPVGEKEGALALGGTKWGVIKKVIVPFGAGGMVGGAMLGLGRALGETIAVTLIISPLFDPHSLPHVLQTGGNSIASLIALRFSESNEFGISALMAAGLTLFVITLIVNALASVIVMRSRSGVATEI